MMFFAEPVARVNGNLRLIAFLFVLVCPIGGGFPPAVER